MSGGDDEEEGTFLDHLFKAAGHLIEATEKPAPRRRRQSDDSSFDGADVHRRRPAGGGAVTKSDCCITTKRFKLPPKGGK